MYCKYCGTVIDDDSVFCTLCGKQQKTIDTPQPQQPSTPSINTIPQASVQQPTVVNTIPQVSVQQPSIVKTVPITRPSAKVSFGDAISRYYKNYANFDGRAVRSEYWWIILYQSLIGIVFYFLFILYSITQILNNNFTFTFTDSFPFILNVLWSLGHLIPGIALVVRRLHDTGRSGGWWFIGLIPLVGSILLIVWECEDSGKDNEWGYSPYGPTEIPIQEPPAYNPMDFSENAEHKWVCVNCGVIVSSQICPNCKKNSIVKEIIPEIPTGSKLCLGCGELLDKSVTACSCGCTVFRFPE